MDEPTLPDNLLAPPRRAGGREPVPHRLCGVCGAPVDGSYTFRLDSPVRVFEMTMCVRCWTGLDRQIREAATAVNRAANARPEHPKLTEGP